MCVCGHVCVAIVEFSLTETFFTLLLPSSHPCPIAMHPTSLLSYLPPTTMHHATSFSSHPSLLPHLPPLILTTMQPISSPPLTYVPPPSPLILSTSSQDVKPLLVTTAMARTSISLSNVSENSRFAPDPITYTCAAIATIGIQHTTYGYFYHALQVRISVTMVTDPSGSNFHCVCVHSTL